MSTRDSNVVGGRELADLLATLPLKIEKNITRTALRAGAKVFLDEVRATLPVDTGALRKSARITTRQAKGGRATASVKVGNRIAYYAQMVEFGTRPHTIKAKPGGAMNVNGSDYKTIEHPGVAPRPFMRPVADAKFEDAVAAFRDKIRERLTLQGINIPDTPPIGEEQS